LAKLVFTVVSTRPPPFLLYCIFVVLGGLPDVKTYLMFMGEGVDVMVNVGLKVTNVFVGSPPVNTFIVDVNVKNNEASDELESAKLSVK
jgi:hypothetical protein